MASGLISPSPLALSLCRLLLAFPPLLHSSHLEYFLLSSSFPPHLTSSHWAGILASHPKRSNSHQAWIPSISWTHFLWLPTNQLLIYLHLQLLLPFCLRLTLNLTAPPPSSCWPHFILQSFSFLYPQLFIYRLFPRNIFKGPNVSQLKTISQHYFLSGFLSPPLQNC